MSCVAQCIASVRWERKGEEGGEEDGSHTRGGGSSLVDHWAMRVRVSCYGWALMGRGASGRGRRHRGQGTEPSRGAETT